MTSEDCYPEDDFRGAVEDQALYEQEVEARRLREEEINESWGRIKFYLHHGYGPLEDEDVTLIESVLRGAT